MPTYKVLVDSREATNHPFWFEDGELAGHIPGTFKYEGLEPDSQFLNFGDIIVPLPDFRSLIIELKTWDDLHAAVRDDGVGREDGRLRHQVRGMIERRKLGDIVVFMLVGTINVKGAVKGTRDKKPAVYVQNTGRRVQRPWSWFELEQTRCILQALGLLTYQIPTSNEIPHAVRLLIDMAVKGEVLQPVGLPQIVGLAPKLNFLTAVLTAVPDIGIVTATAIARRYRTFDLFWAKATIEDLQKVPGIGKTTAERIWSAWHPIDPEPDQDVQIADMTWEKK